MAKFNDMAKKILINNKISAGEFVQHIPYTRADAVIVEDGDNPVYLDEKIIDYDEHINSNHAPEDAEKNVQSDWNVTDTTSDAYIKNKPEGLATETYVDEQIENIGAVQYDEAQTLTDDQKLQARINIGAEYTELDALRILAETGTVVPISSADNSILTNENGNIFVF